MTSFFTSRSFVVGLAAVSAVVGLMSPSVVIGFYTPTYSESTSGVYFSNGSQANYNSFTLDATSTISAIMQMMYFFRPATSTAWESTTDYIDVGIYEEATGNFVASSTNVVYFSSDESGWNSAENTDWYRYFYFNDIELEASKKYKLYWHKYGPTSAGVSIAISYDTNADLTEENVDVEFISSSYGSRMSFFDELYNPLLVDLSSSFITFATPTEDQVMSSTSVDIVWEYFNSGQFDTIEVSLYDEEFNYINGVTPASVEYATGTGTWNVDLTATSTYYILAHLYEYDTGLRTSSGFVKFHTLEKSSFEELINIGRENIIASTTCSISDLTGCVKIALLQMFYPSKDSILEFTGVIDDIKKKSPWGYYFVVREMYNEGIQDTSKTSLIIPVSQLPAIGQHFDDQQILAAEHLNISNTLDGTEWDDIWTDLNRWATIFIWIIFALWVFNFARAKGMEI